MAGRMMSKRIMGKASFSDMRDRYGRLQLYIKRDNVGEDVYKGYKKFDIGDIIGIEGEVFRTQKGEISVSVTELTAAFQKPCTVAGEVARSEGYPICVTVSAMLTDRQPGGTRYL